MGARYFGGTGKHEVLYDELYTALVPARGPAPTAHGELLRVVSNIYHAFHNDGDDTVHALVSMFRVWPVELYVPEDAPSSIHEFFASLREDLGSELDKVGEDCYRIDEEEMERVADATIEYVARVHGCGITAS